MSELRILTVRQPWAWAIIHGGKDVENRVRNVAGDWRGTIAIHVGLQDAPDGWAAIDPPFHDRAGGHYGAIIGVVDLIDVHHANGCPTHADDAPWPLCSAWAERNAWHLELANPRPLAVPIPFRGALGLLRLSEDMAAQVWQAVAS